MLILFFGVGVVANRKRSAGCPHPGAGAVREGRAVRPTIPRGSRAGCGLPGVLPAAHERHQVLPRYVHEYEVHSMRMCVKQQLLSILGTSGSSLAA